MDPFFDPSGNRIRKPKNAHDGHVRPFLQSGISNQFPVSSMAPPPAILTNPALFESTDAYTPSSPFHPLLPSATPSFMDRNQDFQYIPYPASVLRSSTPVMQAGLSPGVVPYPYYMQQPQPQHLYNNNHHQQQQQQQQQQQLQLLQLQQELPQPSPYLNTMRQVPLPTDPYFPAPLYNPLPQPLYEPSGPQLRKGVKRKSSTSATATASVPQPQLAQFWEEQFQQLQSAPIELKNCAMPLARIKKVMKSDSTVDCMISSEVPILLSKAAELFISEISLRAWLEAENNKRRTVQGSDVQTAAKQSPQYDFLIDVLCPPVSKKTERTSPQSFLTMSPSANTASPSFSNMNPPASANPYLTYPMPGDMSASLPPPSGPFDPTSFANVETTFK